MSALGRSRHPLLQLILARLRELSRDWMGLVGLMVVPMVIATVLAFGLRQRGPARVEVAVVESPGAAELAAALDRADGLMAREVSRAEAERLFRRGQARLIVVASATPELIFDPSHDQSRLARFRVADALERLHGRTDALALTDHPVSAPGWRYIDFLIPGLMGLGLMLNCLTLGSSMVWVRSGGLLKRLVATPMRRSHFLFSYMVTRSGIAVAIALYYLLCGWLLFGVQVTGSVPLLLGVCVLGALAFCSVGLLLGSRTTSQDAVGGLTSLFLLGMTSISGVFFSTEAFPAWLRTVVSLLPLTAVNEALRGVLNEGASITAIAGPLAVLAVEALLGFAIALKLFRWT